MVEANGAAITVDVALGPGDLSRAMRAEVAAGLSACPKELAPKWLYDEEGSGLFDAITRLPEYYPTRAERQILVRRAGEIGAVTKADTLIELGSGTSEKTRLLLDALNDAGALGRFVPFDVDEATLRSAAAGVASEYPGVAVHAVVGDFERHLGRLPGGGRRLVAFLGGTIGNLLPDVRAGFLAEIAGLLTEDDALLLGTDLVKATGRLEAAYDDDAGVTAAFNRNLLARCNRELGGDFDLERFEHVARYDDEKEWVEMLLRSTHHQEVSLSELDLSVTFDAGEEMRTEVSAKFRPEGVEAELVSAGLSPVRFWTDDEGDFALSLSVPK
ncbi:MAG: L-histidine N(alpha)-methyltransferase [Acidimicrobiia bacterium]